MGGYGGATYIVCENLKIFYAATVTMRAATTMTAIVTTATAI